MKHCTKILATVLAVLMLVMTACTAAPGNTVETVDTTVDTAPETNAGTSAETTVDTTVDTTVETTVDTNEAETEVDTNAGEDITDVTTYNIIFALATIPPVLSALDAIGNGNETYAIIERGKTYNGIQKTEGEGDAAVIVEQIANFHNAGFNPANNTSLGFTSTEFNTMVAKVQELKAAAGEEKVYFNFYVQDGTALVGAGIAANAGLTADEFHVTMIEDGTGAYAALRKTYITNKTVTAETDTPYNTYVTNVQSAQAQFEAVMGKTDNAIGDDAFKYNIGKAFALAALDNFTYWIQDKNATENILKEASSGDLNTKLLTVFGAEGFDAEVEYTANLKYQKISEAVAELTQEQRTAYLTLMYGDYYQETYDNLTRTERAGETAPTKKLVFIGSRHRYYPVYATSGTYGIQGALTYESTIPQTYAELSDEYKVPFLFPTEADYTSFLAVLNNEELYASCPNDELKHMAQVDTFNFYINYIYTLKMTYAMYGADYDIIMKGHPREAIGASAEWGKMYRVMINEGEENEARFYYDGVLDSVLLGFHATDSIGKYIGMVPYGTAAENLAYLGVEISIAGLPSSTYNGFDTDVDVLFIMADTAEDITGNTSQVKDRFEAGNLTYVNKDGETVDAIFLNQGVVLKLTAQIYSDMGNTLLADAYTQAFSAWLTATHPGATDIDMQGRPVMPETDSAETAA